MGLEINKNKVGLYQINSTISDLLLHEGWITENEVKKILIKRAYARFVENAIEIDMEFPNDYRINGKEQHDKRHMAGKQFRKLGRARYHF
jgi:hypothetical protein